MESRNKTTFEKLKPYKLLEINNKKIRVEIVDKIPAGFVYIKDYGEFALFVKKTMFVDDDEYLLTPKRNAKGLSKKVQHKK